jgi:hypothetical protein
MPQQREVCAGGVDHCADVHDCGVRHVTVCENALVRVQFLNQLLQVLLRVNGNAVRVEASRERGRVLAAGYVGDLRRGERHDVIRGIVSVKSIEVVEVAPGGADDNYSALLHLFYPFNVKILLLL